MNDYQLSYVRNNIKDGANTVGPTRYGRDYIKDRALSNFE